MKPNPIAQRSMWKNVAEEKPICTNDEAYYERSKEGNKAFIDKLSKSLDISLSMQPAPFQLITDSSKKLPNSGS